MIHAFSLPLRKTGLFALFLGYSFLMAQSEVGMLSPLVGPTIEQDEYIRFSLDQVLGWSPNEVDSLRIIPAGEEQFLLFAYFTDGTEQGMPADKAQLGAIRTQIEREGVDMLRTWREYAIELEAGNEVDVILITFEGQRVMGAIQRMDAYLITLLLPGSRPRTLRMEDIARWEEPTTPLKEDNLQLENLNEWEPWPLYMRYTFLPNAIPTEKGDRYLGLTRITFHGAINDNLSVTLSPGLGSALLTSAVPGLFFFSGSSYIKYGYQLKPKLHIAAGGYFAGFFATTPGADAGAVGGWVNGMATYGTRDQNVTLGVGWFGIQGLSSLRTNLQLQERPIVYLGGVKRLGPRIGVMGEAFWWSTNTNTLTAGAANQVGVISLGARFYAYQLIFNAGMAYPLLAERSSSTSPWRVNGLLAPFNFPIPYIDLMLNLERKSR